MRESGAEARSVAVGYIPVSIHLLLDRPSLIYGVVRLVVRACPSSVRVSGGGANDIDAAYFGEKTDG